MIITASDEILNLNTLHFSGFEEALGAILQAHRRGNHFVVLPRALCSQLLSSVPLTRANRATLEQLEQEYTQTGHLLRSSQFSINIRGFSQSPISEAQGQINIPINNSDLFEVLEKPVLILEDFESDGDFYYFIMENLAREGLNFRFSCDPFHGGGDSIMRITQRKLSERRIVITIVDSDRLAPCTNCQKSVSINAMKEASAWPLFFGLVTPCSEVENFIPLEVIQELSVPHAASTLSLLFSIRDKERQNSIPATDFYAIWFDYKNGLNPELFNRIGDPAVRSWISDRLSLANFDPAVGNLPGFGSAVLRSIINSDRSRRKFRNSIKSAEWIRVFGDFVSYLKWLLAAASPRRT